MTHTKFLSGPGFGKNRLPAGILLKFSFVLPKYVSC